MIFPLRREDAEGCQSVVPCFLDGAEAMLEGRGGGRHSEPRSEAGAGNSHVIKDGAKSFPSVKHAGDERTEGASSEFLQCKRASARHKAVRVAGPEHVKACQFVCSV